MKTIQQITDSHYPEGIDEHGEETIWTTEQVHEMMKEYAVEVIDHIVNNGSKYIGPYYEGVKKYINNMDSPHEPVNIMVITHKWDIATIEKLKQQITNE